MPALDQPGSRTNKVSDHPVPMTIAVVIPVLNEESTIVQTLRQTGTLGFDEIVVVDGGSTDRTRAEADALGVARVVISQRGRARQMNEGARKCHGDVLLFLHADTCLPDCARRVIEATLSDSSVVGGRFDVRFDTRSIWSSVISAFMNYRSRITSISTGDQAIFVRRRVFDQLGGFSDIPLMEDIDFSTRLKRTGPVRALSETVTTSFRRWEQRGPLKTILLMWALRFLYWLGISPHRLTHLYKTVR